MEAKNGPVMVVVPPTAITTGSRSGELQRELRVEAEDGAAERAAEAGEAEPKAKVSAKMRVTSIPVPRDARIVDGGAQARTEARLRQAELQCDRQQRADEDDEQAVLVERDDAQIDAAFQRLRHVDDLRARAHEIIDRGDRHEDEADREHHLFEMRLVVEADIERTFEKGAGGPRR